MTAAPALRRRSARRADRPSARLLVVSALFLDALFLVGVVAAWPIYRSTAYLLAVGVALVVAHLLAWAGLRRRWSGWWVALATFAAYVALGLPLAAPSMLGGGVDQSLQALLGVVTAPVTGWKDLLTLDLPLGSYQTTLAPAFFLFLTVPVAALSLAWRARRLWVLAPVLGLVPTVFGVLFGSDQVSAALGWGALALPGPVEMAVGAAALLIALGFVVWRSVDERRRALRAVEAATGVRTTGRSGSAVAGRVLISTAMIAIALTVGAVAAPFAIAGQPREVLRTRIDPHVEIQQQLSPLSQYRAFFSDETYDDVQFTVTTGADRVRLATLSFYDGRVARVLDPGADAGDQSTAFVRVPASLPAPDGGRSEIADIAIAAYDEVWMPTIGSLTSVQFHGGAAAAQADGFFYSAPAQMGVQLSDPGLTTGVTYRLQAAVPADLPVLEDLVPGRETPRLADRIVPESVTDWIRAQQAPAGGAGLALLIDRLRARGYLSHALSIDEQSPPLWRSALSDYTFEPSRAGHSTGRIDALFTALLERQNDVGGADDAALVAAVGDDEQFSVAAAMIADQLGFEVRIVLGARLSADDGDLSACEAGACTGGDIAAWIEVQDTSGVWIPVDVTPQHTDALSPDDLLNRDPEVPTEVRRQGADLVQPPEADPADAADREDVPAPGVDWAAVWAVVRATGIGLLVLLVVTGPFLLVLLIKALRRRARREATTPVDRVTGGWDEYVDAAVDTGLAPPHTQTRQELAALHAGTDAGSRAPLLATIADRSVFDAATPTDADSQRFWDIVDQERARLTDGRGWWRNLRTRLSLRSLLRGRSAGRRGR